MPLRWGCFSAQLILHLQNPNLGPNSVKGILDTRIVDPNAGVEFLIMLCAAEEGPSKIHPQKFTFQNSPSQINPLVDVSDIFYFFFCLGEGKGESEPPGGGGERFLRKIPRGGGLPCGWGPGAGRVFAGNLGGGGTKYFFSGPKFPPSFPCLFGFPCLFLFKESLAILSVFPFFLPKESFEAIFYLAGYFYFARLLLETLRKYPSKQAQKWHSQGYFTLQGYFLPCKVIFTLQGYW